MKTILSIFRISFFLLFIVNNIASAKTVKIKIAVLIPKGSSGSFILENFRQEVKKQTQNRVNLKIYWGGIQGDEKDVIRKIRFKQLQGGLFSGHGLGEIVPAVRITEIPYFLRNHAEVFYIRDRLTPIMDKKFSDKGFVVLGWSSLGFVHAFLTTPTEKVAELKKLKCWVWEDDPIAYAFNKALGITPVSLSIADVLTSVSSGLVDMVAAPPLAALAFRWQTKFKYMANVPAINSIGALVVTKDIWNQVNPLDQKKILEISKKNINQYVEFIKTENQKAVKILKKMGVKLLRADYPESLKQAELAAKKARESLTGHLYDQDLLNKTIFLLKEYRKKNPNQERFILK